MLNFRLYWYRFKHSVFKWTSDTDGDITFRLFWLFNFTKYKEHTIFKLGKLSYEDAGKWQGYKE